MSEVRQLLQAAQQAEIRRDFVEARRLLHQAADWYRDRDMTARAEQMERQAQRLGADTPGDELGFGDSLLADDGPRRRLVEQRGPSPADPSLDAWCSFCCKPKSEVGPVIAGPAGAYICRACVGLSAGFFGDDAPSMAPPPSTGTLKPLPAQAKAQARLARGRPRLALIVGPEGAGKSALARELAAPLEPPFDQLPHPLVVIDVAEPLSAEDEGRLLRWLDERPERQVVLCVRAELPAPVLVLEGEHGPEPVFDTSTLARVVKHLSPQGLARVDAVVPLEAPDRAGLRLLAERLLELRGVRLPVEAVDQLVALAEGSGRGTHELAALIHRIPPGSYAPR